MSYHKENFIGELFGEPSTAFRKHLKISNNHRILFSGKFGIGKTVFIKHFFDDELQEVVLSEKCYRPFHIFPVNYSIASNEDIFRYIKYDVLTSIALNNIQIKHKDFAFIDTLPSFLKEEKLKIFATLLSMIPKVGKDLFEVYEKLTGLKKEFLEHHKNVTASEETQILEYQTSIEGLPGSIYENDLITKLIYNILDRLKKEDSRENVLIIDDLDRIDPEHIFRLLNVFAAHLDEASETPNKLGFDKIIFVCDIRNIRNIFQAKYGQLTDFNGYIDKFYSREIFYFDNKSILKNIAYKAFENTEIEQSSKSSTNLWNSLMYKNCELPIDILHSLIQGGLFSLRNLVKNLENPIYVDIHRWYVFSNDVSISLREQPLLTQFTILKDIIGDYDTFKSLFERLSFEDYCFRYTKPYCEQLIFLLTAETHKFSIYDKLVYYKLNGTSIVLEFIQNTINNYTVRKRTRDFDNVVQHEEFNDEDLKELILLMIDKMKIIENRKQ